MSCDYIKHIKDNHMDNFKKTLCGKDISTFEFVFESIDHWFNNSHNEARLLGCPQCLKKIKEAMI